MRLLLIGHACAPDKGSEPGNTWNWASHLARYHEVWLISYPEHQTAVDQACAAHRNLKVVWVKPTGFDPWDPKRGDQGLRWHYLLWLRAAFRVARELHLRVHFDVVHHLSLGTLSTGSPFWKLSAPFVWGPVGGGQIAPSSFRDYFGPGWSQERVRSLRVRCEPYLPHIRRTVRNANLVLATNYDTHRLLQSAGRGDVRLFLDCGVPPGFFPQECPQRAASKEFVLLWAGRLEARKALPLALEAVAAAKLPNLRLRVVGEGPLTENLQARAGSLGIADQVEFTGRVAHDRMPEIYLSSHAFLFTSLRDSTGSAVLEAMAKGLPVLTLNHQGVAMFVPDDAGIKVPVTTPAETLQALAESMRRMEANREMLSSMGHASWASAGLQTWDLRAQQMTNLYQEITSAHRNF